MSVPEASTTRQRTTTLPEDDEKTPNPSSLGSGAGKKVMKNKPAVKPPFADVSMGRFLTYMVLGLLAIGAYYVWRLTVFAADVGGYWNIVTGKRPSPAHDLAESAAKAASSAASGASSILPTGKVGSDSAVKKSNNGKSATQQAVSKSHADADVQSQILNLANALGIKPAELSAAIRPLIDPSVPNPGEAAQQQIELLKQQVEAQAGAVEHGEAAHTEKTSLLGLVGEALLD